MSESRQRWLRRRCAVCHLIFDATRHDAYLCSAKCRLKAFRMRHRKGYHTQDTQDTQEKGDGQE